MLLHYSYYHQIYLGNFNQELADKISFLPIWSETIRWYYLINLVKDFIIIKYGVWTKTIQKDCHSKPLEEKSTQF